MYSAEMSTPATRGASGALFQFNCVMGGFISTIITMYLDGDKEISWHIGILLPAFPGVLLVFGIWFCPESPRYLIRVKGKNNWSNVFLILFCNSSFSLSFHFFIQYKVARIEQLEQ